MKGKTAFIAIVLIVVIGGSALLYNGLKDRIAPVDLTDTESASEMKSAQEKENSLETPSDEGIKAPDFTVQDAEGNDVKLSDMLGKPVVLNFWASWCPPCKAEMPDFNKVFEELGDDVQFMMVDAVDGGRETKEKGQAYIEEQGFSFPVYFDMEQDAVMQYGIRAFPTSLFIDKDGYVITGAEGMMDEATLRKGIGMITEADEYSRLT